MIRSTGLRAGALSIALWAVPSPSPGQTADDLIDPTLEWPRVHEALAGQAHCVKCHDETQRPSDDRCLVCHEEIRVGADPAGSYHDNVVRRDGQPCTACHREHRGAGEKLVLWRDDEGMRQFDHEATGYRLEGGHAGIECRACHRAKNVASRVTQRSRPEESFLGLSATCATCHDDVHRARLGPDCERCHTVRSWRDLPVDAAFDHGRTDYPLEGLHASVDCRECHGSERYTEPLAFGACTDCHEDHHRGQLADREDGGRCDACHDVNGFTPALFDVAEHDDAGFPLLGSHRAVACNACHPKEALGDGGEETARFELGAYDCRGCHAEEILPGHLADLEEGIECERCHSSDGLEIAFRNHETGKFPLAGRHRELPCVACHGVANEGTADEHHCYTHLGTACQGCHEDRHAGQFGETGCESCHTAESWATDGFDHRVASTYPLEGQHLQVACEACHPLEADAAGTLVRRFKPLDAACESCHAADGSWMGTPAAAPTEGPQP